MKEAKPLRIVVDTNVIVAGLRSRCGASNALIQFLMFPNGPFQLQLSTPVLVQYRSLIARHGAELAYAPDELAHIFSEFLAPAKFHNIFYLWRPWLADPEDEMVLELATAAQSSHIVTFNKKHFRGCQSFGIQPVTPVELLVSLGDLS